MTKTKKTKKAKIRRYSISVSGTIYDQLRARVPHGSMAAFVDEIVETGLDDPEFLARLVASCRGEEAYS